jgi:hypothetical protein
MSGAAPSSNWDAIGRELIAMAETDLRVRAELAADGSLFEGYHPRMRAVHDEHAARLAAILEAHGWPGTQRVGEEGAKAAWLIVQHAIGHPNLQRAALERLNEATSRGEMPPRYAAMLNDRIRTLEGRPQRYGTQYDWDASGAMSPLPIEDPAGVDRRRQTIGLRPLAEETAARRREVESSGERAPSDWAARQRDMERWFRDVGWRR